ncbi:MAG: SDR family oxidoreductase [Pseudomonadota bacterium]
MAAATGIAELFNLQGRTALVTGGSNGLGGSIARVLAQAGADLIIHYASAYDDKIPQAQTAQDQKDAIEALGRRCYLIDQDLGEADAVQKIFEASQAIAHVDILVINASVQCDKTLEEITGEDLDREYVINYKATVFLLQQYVPVMAKSGWGRVLSIGSIQQMRPRRTNPTYAGLKAAQETLMRQFACEYGHRQVLFNTLSPGLIATERNRQLWDNNDAWWQQNSSVNPLGIISGPDDYAGAALLLCSDAARFVTGANLFATGGGHLSYLERDYTER